ncbi:MAG: radical SAM protein [Vulcanimicrobiota bacterium]
MNIEPFHTTKNTVIVLVALYKYQNFPIRIMHSLLENLDGIKPYSIFFKNYDTNVFKVPTVTEEDLFVKQIIDLNPNIVGISVLSPYVPIAKRLTKLIRDNSSALIIWGGIHPTISPESCIKETDIICVGEGEGAIKDLVINLRDGKEYLTIDNLWINNGSHIIRNPMRPLIQDLDSIPFPCYGNDSFYFINHNRIARNDPAIFGPLWIQTSRGCPFVCSYCVNSLLQPLFKNLGHYSRRRSVSNTIREIKEYLNVFGSMERCVIFVDEIFGQDESWLNEFESTYKREIGLPFYVEYNPKLINSALLDKLVNAGVHTINFGIQTGSDYIRNHIFHRPGKNDEIIDVANNITNKGINITYDLIIDNPYDTEQSLKNAISFLLELPKPLFFHLYSLQYFPDYPLTLKAIEDGYIKVEDASIDSLMDRTTMNWAFVPKLMPLNLKQILQNIIWLVVWAHQTDKIVKYAVFNNSLCSRLCLHYLNFKAVVWGKVIGAGGIISKHTWIQYLLKGFKYIFKGNIKSLYLKIRKRFRTIRT